jgi:hypothetical protein
VLAVDNSMKVVAMSTKTACWPKRYLCPGNRSVKVETKLLNGRLTDGRTDGRIGTTNDRYKKPHIDTNKNAKQETREWGTSQRHANEPGGKRHWGVRAYIHALHYMSISIIQRVHMYVSSRQLPYRCCIDEYRDKANLT